MKNVTFQSITDKLLEINKKHPSYSFSNITSMAFAEYKDIWGLTNRECLFALEKYEAELELDSDNIASPEYLEKLYKDVENFDDILKEDEDE